MVGGSARDFRLHAFEAELPQVQLIDEDIITRTGLSSAI